MYLFIGVQFYELRDFEVSLQIMDRQPPLERFNHLHSLKITVKE